MKWIFLQTVLVSFKYREINFCKILFYFWKSSKLFFDEIIMQYLVSKTSEEEAKVLSKKMCPNHLEMPSSVFKIKHTQLINLNSKSSTLHIITLRWITYCCRRFDLIFSNFFLSNSNVKSIKIRRLERVKISKHLNCAVD
jgi:hypothetical protein